MGPQSCDRITIPSYSCSGYAAKYLEQLYEEKITKFIFEA